MLRITTIKSSKSAKEYYTNALEKGDYYIKDVELENYKGELAKRLGINNLKITKENFCQLSDNIHPLTAQKITVGADRIDRKPMYDFTFSTPKSVSILYALTEDQKLKTDILKTFNDCVDYALKVSEKEFSLTRDQKGGKNQYIQTNNLLYAGFQHETSRPVNGIPDPHLHKHCTVMNMTYDAINNCYKSMEFLDFCSFREFTESVFESELAHRLQHNLNFACVNKNKSFELAGYTEEMIMLFSRRTVLIEQIAKEKLITNPNKKGELGKKTRETKKEIKEKTVVLKDWLNRVNSHKDLNSLYLRPQKYEDFKSDLNQKANISQVSLDGGLRHYLQYESTPLKARLISYSLKYNIVDQNFKSISKVYDKNIKDQKYIVGKTGRNDIITTPAVINEEKKILELINNGLTGGSIINTKAKPDPKLTQEQITIFNQVMTSNANINYIKGDAGTGKTFTINQLQKSIKEAGYAFQAYAPTSIAGRKVLREEVTKNANTIQAFLKSESLQRSADNRTVIVVDEAGTIGNENILQLLELQKLNNFKLILVGDTKQNPPVERGEPLKMIEEKSNIVPLTLTQNYRQKDNLVYQEAINHFAKFDIKTGLEKLDNMKAIKEIASPTVRNKAIAQEYIKNVQSATDFKTGLKDNLVVIPTHAEAKKVTHKIREELKDNKLIDKTEINYTILRDKELSTEQKRDNRNYDKSDVIIFNNNHEGGINKGSTWNLKWNKSDQKYQIVNQKNNEEKVESKILDLPINNPDKYKVMVTDIIQIAKGDQLIMNSSFKDQNNKVILNKSRYIIDNIKINKETGDKTIVLNNNYILPVNHQTISHGYTSTSYSSQGITAKNVIASHIQESKGAISYQESYVKLSRGKEKISIYTDNKAKMYNSISQVRQKGFGLDILKKQNESKERIVTR